MEGLYYKVDIFHRPNDDYTITGVTQSLRIHFIAFIFPCPHFLHLHFLSKRE